jgi:hypothetical protein
MPVWEKFKQLFVIPLAPLPPIPIQLGRYTTVERSAAQTTAWEAACDAYEAAQYVDAYRHFFAFLRDPSQDNVLLQEGENGTLHFELLQGSKRVMGVANAEQVKAESRVAHVTTLNVAYLRRLMEQNFVLQHSRYCLSDDNDIVLKFETSTLDGSPYKLYDAFKEIAVDADKQDDLLADEFSPLLTLHDTGSMQALPNTERQLKYDFLQTELRQTFDLLDKNSAEAEKYPEAYSYLLLALTYKLDYLLHPEGYMMEVLERAHRLFFETAEGKKTPQRNALLRQELQKIQQRSAADTFKELYRTRATFAVLSNKTHDSLVSTIDGELSKMDWYIEEKLPHLAMAIPNFIVGYLLFNYALPKPDRDLLQFYYLVTENVFFVPLGFTAVYFEKNKLQKTLIETHLRGIEAAYKADFPNLHLDLKRLKYNDMMTFAKTYLLMLRDLDLSK